MNICSICIIMVQYKELKLLLQIMKKYAFILYSVFLKEAESSFKIMNYFRSAVTRVCQKSVASNLQTKVRTIVDAFVLSSY